MDTVALARSMCSWEQVAGLMFKGFRVCVSCYNLFRDVQSSHLAKKCQSLLAWNRPLRDRAILQL